MMSISHAVVFGFLALAQAPPPASAPPVDPSQSAPPEPTYASLAALPCPARDLDAALAADFRAATAALSDAQRDVDGLPAEAGARLPLLAAIVRARDELCGAEGPTPWPELPEILAGEGNEALKDVARGHRALALERANRSEEARPLWVELRSAERPSEWLVRAFLAGADASIAGDLEFSAAQLFSRAIQSGGRSVHCYVAFRRLRVSQDRRDEAAVQAAMGPLAAAIAAAGADPVCRWVGVQVAPTPP